MSGPPTATGASGGLREAMSCNVCSEVYEQALRTPLVLPCGHTFCRTCLTDIKKSGRFMCPTCRAGHNNLQVEALTVNYSLLNILPLCNQFECDKCAMHGDDLRYWCATCDLPLCSICLYSGHPQGHTVKLAQTFVMEKKQVLVEKIKVIFQNIEGHKKELKQDFNDLDMKVKELFRRNTHLLDTEMALSDLLADTQKANDIISVLYFEKAVGDFQSKEKNMFGSKETHLVKAEEGKAVLEEKSDKEAEEAEAEHPEAAAAEAVKEGTQACQEQQLSGQTKQQTTEESQESTEVPRAVMGYRDGRLLLHTLAEPTTTRLSLQVPCEVFLELGVGDRHLGCVYISLWCHLRQAQQFLALCMGTMGPSILGTKASEKVRNTIVFRSAIDRNKQSVAQPLLMGLEWGGQHSKTEAEGLVTGMAGNNGIAFGICTQGQTNAAMHAPFGMVVAGLEVANDAFQHNPVTEVTITHCGLVLPGLSQ